jgi:hypothetical protein
MPAAFRRSPTTDGAWSLARVLRRALLWGALAPAAALLLWAVAPWYHGPGPAAEGGVARAAPPFAPTTAVVRPRAPRTTLLTTGLVPSFATPARDGAAGARAPELNRGLSAYFRFDDGYGSTSARDLSVFGRDCRMHQLDPNGAWTEGALGGAIDVGRGFLECPQPPASADDGAEMSVSAWVRVDVAQTELMAIVARQVADGNEDAFLLGVFRGQLKVRSDLWKSRLTARKRVPLQRWTHVGFTRVRDGTVRLYMNGNEVGRSAQRFARSAPAPVQVTGALTIGAGINGPNLTSLGQKLPGAVDEVAIYDRALAASEMAALAHGAQPRLSP